MLLGTRLSSSLNLKSIIFGLVIFCACAAFIFTGFGTLRFGNLLSMSSNTAATVGELNIPMQEFAKILNLQGVENLPPIEKKNSIKQLMQALIAENILANEANKLGWEANDDEIASIIKTAYVFQDPLSHKFSLQLFKKYLDNQQNYEIDFYNSLRIQLSGQKMQNLLSIPMLIPTAVAQLEYEINNTKFALQYAFLHPADIKKILKNDLKNKDKNRVEAEFLAKLYADINASLNKRDNQGIEQILKDNHLIWQDLEEPFKISDSYIKALGSTTQLAEEIFVLKKPGDIIYKIIFFGKKAALIKLKYLISPTQLNSVTLDQIKSTMAQEQLNLFINTVKDYLFQFYTINKLIKINSLIDK